MLPSSLLIPSGHRPQPCLLCCSAFFVIGIPVLFRNQTAMFSSELWLIFGGDTNCGNSTIVIIVQNKKGTTILANEPSDEICRKTWKFSLLFNEMPRKSLCPFFSFFFFLYSFFSLLGTESSIASVLPLSYISSHDVQFCEDVLLGAKAASRLAMEYEWY